MNSRLDKNNSGKSHKKIIIISIVAILFVFMLMVTVASLSIAGKSTISAENAKQASSSQKASISSESSSKESINTSSTSVSSSVPSSTESLNSYEATSEEQSMYFTRMRIGLAVGKAMYSDNGKEIPKLDYFEEIPNGFKIYFEDGMSYKIRDTGFDRNLASEYNFGNNHGFEIYSDDNSTVTLEIPKGLGGVVPEITPAMLKQYAIR